MPPRARRSPHRRGLRRPARVVLLAALALALLAPLDQSTTPAAASPAQVARLEAQLGRLNDQADLAVEDFLQAQLELGRTRAQLAQVQAQARAAQRHLADLRGAIAGGAALAYELGPAGDLGTVLDAADPTSVVRRMESLDLLAQHHNDQLVELRAAAALLAARRAAVASVERRQAQETVRREAKKAEILRLGELRAGAAQLELRLQEVLNGQVGLVVEPAELRLQAGHLGGAGRGRGG